MVALSPTASTLPLSSGSSDRKFQLSQEGNECLSETARKARRRDLFGAYDWERKGSLNDPYQPRDSLGIGSEGDILRVDSSHETSENSPEGAVEKEKESKGVESGGDTSKRKKE